MFKSIIRALSRLDSAVQKLAEKTAKEQDRKIFYIDVGSMSPAEATSRINQIAEDFRNKQVPA